MRFETFIFCLISVAVSAVHGRGNNLGTRSDSDRQVSKMTTFPVVNHRHGTEFYKRSEEAKPQCSFQYGLARVDETATNLDTLQKDKAGKTCTVQAGVCSRPVHEGHAALYICNYTNRDMQTPCKDLITHAKQIFQACRFGDAYTHGHMVGKTAGPGGSPYIVALGDDGVFLPSLG